MTDAEGATREVAVVDVGSNSVRLAVYRIEQGAIWTVFNEKVLAGLGRGLGQTGRLSEDGVKAALTALRRFAAVIEGLRPGKVFVVATAAVRDAEDGGEFCERVAAETGLRIRVLPGIEEARYAALGVLAGAPSAEGVVGDLGGASLELTRVTGGEVEPVVTLAVGPFALANGKPFDAARLRRLIGKRLEPASGLSAPIFHAVGGAWRTLAQLHMAISDYPLRIVHQYAMGATDVLELARLVGRQSPQSIEKFPGVSKKRAETLPYAALVLEALIERLEVRTVSFSAWGVREGVLAEALARDGDHDPLLAGSAVLATRQGVSPALAGAICGWLGEVLGGLEPVFGAERDRTLTLAACRYADIGARLHPDHRVELAFDQVLRAPIPGQSHAERAFLAAAINARYGGPTATPEPRVTDRLLNTETRSRARVLGLAIRLAADLSARAPQVLADTRLRLSNGTLSLTAKHPDVLMGEQTQKRARALAEALGATFGPA